MNEYTIKGTYHKKRKRKCRGCGEFLFYNRKDKLYYCPACNVKYDE